MARADPATVSTPTEGTTATRRGTGAGAAGGGATASFGFTEVAREQKQGMVAEVFHNVASDYDRMNDAMSLGV